jgi:hypothetical protein
MMLEAEEDVDDDEHARMRNPPVVFLGTRMIAS